MKLQSGTSTDQRPEMAKRSEEVLMASGKDIHQNSETSLQMPKEEQHASRAIETQVTEKEECRQSDP